MLKGGFPPIYPIDPNSIVETKDNIKRNFSSNNIIDINSILLKKNPSRLVGMLNLSEHTETDDNNNDKKNENKKKNRNFKNEQIDDKNFINFISDMSNIKKINRVKKSSKKKLK